MALTLKVDGYDLSSFVQAYEDALDPADPEYLQPQYAGAPALSEGLTAIGDAVGNRKMIFPLALHTSPPTTDGANTLVQTLNSHLFRGASVEFKPDGASSSSFLDLEDGTFRPHYKHAHHRRGWVLGALELTVRPYANTGTTRLAASLLATGPVQFPVTGILGDIGAEARVRAVATVASVINAAAGEAGVVLWGVHHSASFIGIWPAASLGATAPNTPTLIGASGGIASQHLGLQVNPGNVSLTLGANIESATQLAGMGRVRVLALFNSQVQPATALSVSLYDPTRDPSLSTALSTAVATRSQIGGYQVLDAGELDLGLAETTRSAIPPNVAVRLSVASGASSVASPNVLLTGLMLLPVSEGVGVYYLPSSVAPRRHGAAVAPRPPTAGNDLLIDGVGQLGVVSPSATAPVARWEGQYRGAAPRIAPTGSPMASGPAQMVVLAGSGERFVGNGGVEVSVHVRERFTFLR